MFDCDGKAIQEGFIENIAAHISTIRRSLTLAVSRGDHSKPRLRINQFVGLLDIDRIAFKNWLKTHDLGRTKIDLVQQQHGTTFHCFDCRTVLPHRVAINQSEATNQIVLVGNLCDVGTNEFSLGLGTGFIYHLGLTITRFSSDIHRKE